MSLESELYTSASSSGPRAGVTPPEPTMIPIEEAEPHFRLSPAFGSGEDVARRAFEGAGEPPLFDLTQPIGGADDDFTAPYLAVRINARAEQTLDRVRRQLGMPQAPRIASVRPGSSATLSDASASGSLSPFADDHAALDEGVADNEQIVQVASVDSEPPSPPDLIDLLRRIGVEVVGGAAEAPMQLLGSWDDASRNSLRGVLDVLDRATRLVNQVATGRQRESVFGLLRDRLAEPLIGPPRTFVGQVIRSQGSYITGYAAFRAALVQARSLGPAAQAFIAGGLADFFAVNPNDPNLASLIGEFPILGELATRPDDPELVNRARNVVVGAFGSGVAEGVIRIVQRRARRREQQAAGQAVQPAAVQAGEPIAGNIGRRDDPVVTASQPQTGSEAGPAARAASAAAEAAPPAVTGITLIGGRMTAAELAAVRGEIARAHPGMADAERARLFELVRAQRRMAMEGAEFAVSGPDAALLEPALRAAGLGDRLRVSRPGAADPDQAARAAAAGEAAPAATPRATGHARADAPTARGVPVIELDPVALAEASSRVAALAQRSRVGSFNAIEQLGPVTARGAAEINRLLNGLRAQAGNPPLDVTGWTHTINADALRHARNRHVGAAKHDPRNVPLVEDDFALIPEILAAPDLITVLRSGGRNAPPTIRFERRYNGTVYVVEEAQAVGQRLAFQTMYKHQTEGGSGVSRPMPEGPSPKRPEPSAAPRRDPERSAVPNENIGAEPANVNPDHAARDLRAGERSAESGPDAAGRASAQQTPEQGPSSTSGQSGAMLAPILPAASVPASIATQSTSQGGQTGSTGDLGAADEFSASQSPGPAHPLSPETRLHNLLTPAPGAPRPSHLLSTLPAQAAGAERVGLPRLREHGNEPSAREASALLYGVVQALQDSVRLAATGPGSVLRLDRARGVGIDLERAGPVGALVDFLDYASAGPAQAGDPEGRLATSNTRVALHAEAYRRATAEGLSGEALTQRVGEIVANPPAHIRFRMADQTETRALLDVPSDYVRRLVRLRNARGADDALPFDPLLLTLPLLANPESVLEHDFTRSPLSLHTARLRDDLAARGARRDLALAQLSLGSAVMLLAGNAAADGAITGASSPDGAPTHSMRIGGQWQSYDPRDPVGRVLAFAADLRAGSARGEIEPEDLSEWRRLYAAGALAASALLRHRAGFDAAMRTLAMLADPDRAAPAQAAPFARAVAPLGQDADPLLFPERNLRELSGRLLARRNLWGETQAADHPIDRELSVLDHTPQRIRRQTVVAGVPVDLRPFPQVYEEYVQRAGNELPIPAFGGLGLRDYLNAVVSGEGGNDITRRARMRYTALRDDDERVQVIETTITQARAAAGQSIIDDPRFAEFRRYWETQRLRFTSPQREPARRVVGGR